MIKRKLATSGAIAVIAVLVTVASCSTPLSPADLLMLQNARARWDARGFDDYIFVTRISCFCPPPIGSAVEITVRNNQVTRVRYAALDSTVAGSDLEDWYTIDELFDEIPRLTDSSYLDRLEVEYDPVLGYPTFINTVHNDRIADAGITYRVEHLRTLGAD